MVHPRELRHRVGLLLHQRPLLRAHAAAFVRDYYRTHRRLPAGYVLALLPRAKIRRLLVRGEIEHVLGLAGIFARFARLRQRGGS
jgi:hypothetical protein